MIGGYGELANLRFRSGANVLLQQSIPCDALGRIVRVVDAAVDPSRTWAYGYDAAGRFERVWRNTLLVEQQWYDANGNVQSVHGAGGTGDTATTTTDAQDRLLRHGGRGTPTHLAAS